MSTMKVLLVLTILHASGIIDIGTNAASVIVKREDLSPKKVLADINKERVKVAKQFGIPNMSNLTWSDELAAKAKKVPRAPDCSILKDGKDYRYFIMEKDSEIQIRRGQQNRTISQVVNNAMFSQPQTKVGCNVEFTCKQGDERWEGLCFIGGKMSYGPDRSENKPIIESSQSDTHSVVQVTETPKNKETSDSTDGASSSIFMLSCLIPMLLLI